MEFDKLLQKTINKQSFCVVGNGPNEIGRKRGKIIDDFKTVIRFNDFSSNYNIDYGSKTNIWVRASNDAVIESLDSKLKEDFNMIFFRSIGSLSEKSIDFLSKHKKKYEDFPIYYENKLSKKLNSIPSTGLLFLYILKENGFVISPKNVFGFSFFDKKDLVTYGSHHYFDPKQKHLKGISLAKHHWARERDYFYKYIIGR